MVRERHSNPMNRPFFMKREQKEKTGGEDALPQWTPVILTAFLLYCEVQWSAATDPRTPLYSLCMHTHSDSPYVRLPCCLFMQVHSNESNVLLTPYSSRYLRERKDVLNLFSHKHYHQSGTHTHYCCSCFSLSLSVSFFLSLYLCLSLLLIYFSLSLWFRTKLAVHHPVYGWNIPPNHLGDSVCLLETIQVRTTLSPHSSPSSLLFCPTPLSPLFPSLSYSL